jgi:hypothetical protein
MIADDSMLRNLREIVRLHKKSCHGECDVSLLTLRFWCAEHGLKFTKEDGELFD